MKKLLAVIIALMLPVCVLAEDLSAMSTEDLLALRLAVNEELASRNIPEEAPEGASIADLFPDTWLAKNIRDKLGKFSTKDIVTQEELDTINSINIDGQTTDHIQVTTLEGIQYLRNLTKLYVCKQESIHEVPEWIGDLINLKELTFRICPITKLPDSVCNLVNLTMIGLDFSTIEALPDDIGNLINLKKLDIGHTNITELPASIYNLKLETFYREGLDID